MTIPSYPIPPASKERWTQDHTLIKAIVDNDIPLMQQALDKGADIDAFDCLPMMVAALTKNRRAIKVLYFAGADINYARQVARGSFNDIYAGYKNTLANISDQVREIFPDKNPDSKRNTAYFILEHMHETLREYVQVQKVAAFRDFSRDLTDRLERIEQALLPQKNTISKDFDPKV